MRKESRGLHYTLDYPQADETKSAGDTILTPKKTDKGNVHPTTATGIEKLGGADN
jgi:succinate dehydrogenase/fumarate reductase flavoprotein subunit